MEIRELEIYSEAGNSSIIRMTSRHFPGVVIQGDSLFILFRNAMTLVATLANTDNEESFLTALELAEQLEGHLRNYEATLKSNGISLPYNPEPSLTTSKYARRWGANDSKPTD